MARSYKDLASCIYYSVMDNMQSTLQNSLVYCTFAGAPKYSAMNEQVAYVDEPFEFDFNYIAQSPPSMYSWYKDGRPYKADGRRVMADHTGMIFTRVLREDAGKYTVQAYTPRTGVSTRASSTLRGKQLSRFKYSLL